MSKRDYKKEYREWQGKPEHMKERAKRNAARREAIREGKVKKGDGKDIDHKVPLKNGGTNSKSNLRVVDRKTNRAAGAAIREGKRKK